LLPWSPLGGGWLSGKYRRDTPPSGATRLGENPQRGMEAWEPRNAKSRTWEIIDAVREIADAHGVSSAQVALRWLADRPAVTSVILGARTQEQLADNLKADALQLEQEETERLTKVSEPELDVYPYGEQAVQQRSRKIEGGR
ncbi:MAG TPA: aldo/keto reductase, partial [Sinomonas sp.]|nr:aldo/keto reductase [Sinomonas sp.]